MTFCPPKSNFRGKTLDDLLKLGFSKCTSLDLSTIDANIYAKKNSPTLTPWSLVIQCSEVETHLKKKKTVDHNVYHQSNYIDHVHPYSRSQRIFHNQMAMVPVKCINPRHCTTLSMLCFKYGYVQGLEFVSYPSGPGHFGKMPGTFSSCFMMILGQHIWEN